MTSQKEARQYLKGSNFAETNLSYCHDSRLFPLHVQARAGYSQQLQLPPHPTSGHLPWQLELSKFR